MTEKLKYKVGDKVMIEAKIEEADSYDTYPYRFRIGNAITGWVKADELKKSLINLPLKPKIPQAVMDWYEEHENEWADWDIRDWLSATQEYDFVDEWISANNVINLDRQHALATLIAYGPEAVEVEKEKKYVVILKVTKQSLYKPKDDNISIYFSSTLSSRFTKQELIDAGFEGVFDNPMFEVEEVA